MNYWKNKKRRNYKRNDIVMHKSGNRNLIAKIDTDYVYFNCINMFTKKKMYSVLSTEQIHASRHFFRHDGNLIGIKIKLKRLESKVPNYRKKSDRLAHLDSIGYFQLIRTIKDVDNLFYKTRMKELGVI